MKKSMNSFTCSNNKKLLSSFWLCHIGKTYIKSSKIQTTISDLAVKYRLGFHTDCEITWIQLQISNCKSLFLADFYRPLSSNTEYLQNLHTSLTHITSDKHIWTEGDFKLPDIKWTTSSSLKPIDVDTPNCIIPHTMCQLHDTFIDIMNTFSLSQTEFKSTHARWQQKPFNHWPHDSQLTTANSSRLTFTPSNNGKPHGKRISDPWNVKP